MPAVAETDSKNPASHTAYGSRKHIINTAIPRELSESASLNAKRPSIAIIIIMPALIMEGVKPTIAIYANTNAMQKIEAVFLRHRKRNIIVAITIPTSTAR